ncbi:SIR2 family protein [Pseudomonas aeruginosa]|jgi:NAD-dependent SIR2 family protein deacetylase|nr:SIR2 family protein [Pseudomonas aeruginosa]ELV3031098.1 SIR2 family protein [Pseudomonas aeruginosa]
MSETLIEIDPASSILFLGSGFSAGAESIRGEAMPSGKGLKEMFARELNVRAEDYDLTTLADEFALDKDLNLYQTVYEIFTTSKAKEYQEKILSNKWQRIYTTNYDDLVEKTRSDAGEKIHSYSFEESKPSRLEIGAIIHLHGCIRSATEENVLQQLVLNESSYVRQHIERSVWYDEFVRDLKFCTNCFFIGYSLADMHVAALLMKNDNLRKKIFFVTRDLSDSIFNRRVAPYGSVLPVGAEGFAELCMTLPRPTLNVDPTRLKAFRYLDPQKDKRTLAPPTPIEILNLVTYGKFSEQRCLSTLPESTYVIARKSVVAEAQHLLSSHKCILVHSRIGNGKTIFLHILAHKLAEDGYRCYMCKENAEVPTQDLDVLAQVKKAVILFDSYNTAIDVIPRCSHLENVKFVVAVRTGVQEVRLHEIQSKLPASLTRLNINKLEPDDRDDLKRLLNFSGVRVDELEREIDRSHEIREVVVSLYQNQQIRDRITTELEPLTHQENARKVLVCAHLVKWIGGDLEASFLRAVSGEDPYALRVNGGAIALDLLQFDDDNVQARSALFSEYLIQNHFQTSWIVDAVYSLVVEAVRRKRSRGYQKILGSLMRFSALDWALRRDPNRHAALIALYDRLHRDSAVNAEPLFWLQYAILMMSMDDLDATERFLITAYDRAEKNPGFKTYQIDTQALHYVLVRETQDSASSVTRYDMLIEKLRIVAPMLAEDSHRSHAVQVMQDIEPFVKARVNALSITQKNDLVTEFDKVLVALERFDVMTRAETGSIPVSESIERAKRAIWLS